MVQTQGSSLCDHKIGISVHELFVALQTHQLVFAHGAAVKLTDLFPSREMAGLLLNYNLRRW